MTALRHHPRTFLSPDGTPEAIGPDWSYQRRIITEAIHAIGCLGWELFEGDWHHKCRSVAGNVGASLTGWDQLVPDDFRNPAAVPDECPSCEGRGYWVLRTGPDDNVEQIQCEVCMEGHPDERP